VTTSRSAASRRIAPDRWPTEIPLLFAVVVTAIAVWILLVVSIFGILYALFIGVFFFLSHVAFVSYVRGSGVRLGPEQFPELHHRIESLARAMDMEPPAAYLMQAGGALNAFATRFLGHNLVVLYSDLLEACGENEGARDMIIAHELGHVRCGHLRWMWFLLPGYFVPFLGSALSRAREYTCDRFGAAGAGNVRDATLGLAILSAGPKFGPDVNLDAFARQRTDTNTGLMTIGEWFSSHPPLSKRVVAIDPSVTRDRFHPTRGRAMALAILAAVAVGGSVGAARVGSRYLDAIEEAAGLPETADDPEVATARVHADFETLASFIAEEWPEGTYPASMTELSERWYQVRDTPLPIDPFDGYPYGYDRVEDGYRLWSSGPDGDPVTDDDIVFDV